jgi:16S rRNA (cytosine1402-N4)-methyltransferase
MSNQTDFSHIPVLSKQVIESLNIKTGEIIVDTTVGGGGHLELIAQKVGLRGKAIGFDQDDRAMQLDAAGRVREKYPQVILIKQKFSNIKFELLKLGIEKIDGLLCDLGVSSHHLDNDKRGFSFMHDGPIDMRMDQQQDCTAFDLLRDYTEKDLADIIYKFGEERKSRKIAKIIKHLWPISNSTLALAEIIKKAIGQKKFGINPATKTFQALRIAVNNELGELEALLNSLPNILAQNGRAVFISFHSLEDRMVKLKFKELAVNKAWQILYKKPLIADIEEIKANRRSRSAKLRAIKRL